MTEVMAWNVRDGFGDTERSGRLVEEVLRAQPDAAFFPEAVHEAMLGSDEFGRAADTFRSEGYDVLSFAYDDTDGRTDRHGFLAIGRNIQSAWAMSMGSRKAANMRIFDEESQEYIRLFGVHLDDRQETTRQAQVTRLLGQYALMEGPAAIVGDLNTLHRTDPHARLARTVGPLATMLPSIEPGEYHALSGAARIMHLPHRIGSLAARLSQMGGGGTLQLIEQYGFVDADPNHVPTKGRFQLDHVMFRFPLTVGTRGLIVRDSNGLSDHNPITVPLRVM